MNTSATGGTLTAAMPDNVALRRFFQGLIAATTTLAPALVRPAWQRNPPPAPGFDVNWCAFRVSQREALGAIRVRQNTNDATVTYDERVTISTMFYGPRCEDYAEMLRDGLPIAQNREPLMVAGMGLEEVGELLRQPELVNDQWLDRCDMDFTVTREVSKLYKILGFAGAVGEIITETMTLPFEVAQP